MTAPKLSVATNAGRWYCRPGSTQPEVPSVTNIKGMLDKAWLPGWAVKVTANYVADNLEKLGYLDRNERIRLIKGARFEQKDASDTGNIVHDLIDRIVKGEVITPEEIQGIPVSARHTMQSFEAFRRMYKPTFNRAEFTVWSDTHGYAGTADLDITLPIPDGSGTRRVLVDTKTGNDVYWDTGLQLAALGKADYIINEMGGHDELPTFDAYAILHLRPTFFKLVPVHFIDECFDAFLGLKAAFDLKWRYSEAILGIASNIKTSTVPA